jgi:Ca2+-binding RTX toxin-like protein
MATFDMSKSASGVNLQSYMDKLAGHMPGFAASPSSTGYDWVTAPVSQPLYKATVHFGGTGFTYPTTAQGLSAPPTSGNVTSITLTETAPSPLGSVSTSIAVTGLSLTTSRIAGTYYGFSLDSSSIDMMFFSGDDTVIGSSYNDVLYAGYGNNTINGGAGSDTVSYFDRMTLNPTTNTPSGIAVDLATGVVQLQEIAFVNNAPQVTNRIDTLISIENVIGGTYNDTLSGAAGANTLWGMGGNDTLDGRAGDDILNGGAGDDILIGGLGTDTADYSSDNYDRYTHVLVPDSVATGLQGAVVDLVAGQSWGAFGHDTLTSIENVNGSAGDDWISGTATANTLSGNLGADTIYGLGGDDIIFGGAGNDGLYGGDGNDRIESGAGVDYVEGGLGNDTLIDDSGSAVPHEWSALYGGAGNDKIEGRGLGDVGMWGGDGSDTLTFGAGKSFAYGGAGADVFQFGSDALIGSVGSANLAQVYDYQLGVDHIHLNGTATVLNWGVNTGIDITNASGVHETIMLMGITSAQLQATNWLI